ncbi:MAG: flippase [Dehalococcoidia bacterium]|jgi:O-antigen/teichoic acid export membrane protein|nr:flippase [Dehalococcoidia bacterium]
MLNDALRAGISLLVPAATHLLLRLYIGRSLGQEGLGLYSLTWAIYSFALIFGTLGIGAGLTRYAAQMGRSVIRHSRLLVTGIMGVLAVSVVVAVLMALTAHSVSVRTFGTQDLYPFIIMAAVALPGAATGKVVLGYLNGRRRLGVYAGIVTVQSLAIAACTVLLVQAGYGITGAVFGLLAPIAATGFASLAVVAREVALGLAPPRSRPFSASLFRFGLLVTLTNSVGLIQGYTDTLMIGGFLTERDVGLYAAALLLMEVVRFPGSAAQLATTPRIAALWTTGNTAAIADLVNRALTGIATVVLPAAFACMVGGQVLLRALFGSSFTEGASAMAILMPGATMIGIWAAVGALLSSTGHVRTAFRFSAISAAINVPLNTILIPLFGIEGAALATTLSVGLGCLLQARAAQIHVGLSIEWRRPTLVGLALMAAAVVAVLTDTNPHKLYALGLWWFGATALCGSTLLGRQAKQQALRWLVRR